MPRIAAAFVAGLITAACGAVMVEPPPGPPQTQEEAGADTTQAAAPPAQLQRGSDAWCARSLCGCWEDATLTYASTLRAPDGAPASGVDAICHGEETPIARSDTSGEIAFEIATQRSPGCGYQRCRNMILRDPEGRYAEEAITVASNGGVVTLEPAH